MSWQEFASDVSAPALGGIPVRIEIRFDAPLGQLKRDRVASVAHISRSQFLNCVAELVGCDDLAAGICFDDARLPFNRPIGTELPILVD